MRFIPLTICLSISMLFLACNNTEQNASASAGDVAEKIQSVGIVMPQARNFSSEVGITGTAMPNQMVKVHAMESGFIRHISKDIGDYVSKGSVIAQMDNPDLASQFKQKEAQLTMAEAVIKKHEAEKEKWNSISVSKKSVLDRIKKSYASASNIVSLSDLENASSEYNTTKGNFNIASASLDAARGERDAAAAMADAFRSRVAMLQVKAPFSGFITKRMMDNGATVQSGLSSSGSLPIVEMQDISKVRLTVQVPESDAGNISKGSVVKVNFPELTGGTFDAKVSRTSNTLDPSSKTMQLEIDINNADGKIKPGMYAKVQLSATNRTGVLSLPIAAKKLLNDMPHLLLVEGDVVKAIPLQQGMEGREFFEVLNSNVTKDSKVIVQGKNLVKAGQRVRASLMKE